MVASGERKCELYLTFSHGMDYTRDPLVRITSYGSSLRVRLEILSLGSAELIWSTRYVWIVAGNDDGGRSYHECLTRDWFSSLNLC